MRSGASYKRSPVPRRRAHRSWSSIWYLLSAFAVISYTKNPIYTLFAAAGSWFGAYCAVTWLSRADPQTALRQVDGPTRSNSLRPASESQV
jgi:hypothetical protein